jgi:hypothetical protein
MLDAWERFAGPEGDIRYFDGVSDLATISLNNVKESFEDLLDLEQDLVHLDKSCLDIRTNVCVITCIAMACQLTHAA